MLKQSLILENPQATVLHVGKSDKEDVRDDIIRFDSENLKPNHHIFEFNKDSLEIKPAEIVSRDVLLTNKRLYIEVKRNAGCVYMPGLNAQNVERKLKNLFNKRHAANTASQGSGR